MWGQKAFHQGTQAGGPPVHPRPSSVDTRSVRLHPAAPSFNYVHVIRVLPKPIFSRTVLSLAWRAASPATRATGTRNRPAPILAAMLPCGAPMPSAFRCSRARYTRLAATPTAKIAPSLKPAIHTGRRRGAGQGGGQGGVSGGEWIKCDPAMPV